MKKPSITPPETQVSPALDFNAAPRQTAHVTTDFQFSAEQIRAMTEQVLVANSAEQAAAAPAEASTSAGQGDEPRLIPRDLSKCRGSYHRTTLPPEYQWVLKGSLPRGVFGIVAAAPGVGKSSVCHALCAAVATGTPWMEYWQTEKPGRAIYLSAEDSETTIHRRAYALFQTLGDEGKEYADNLLSIASISSDASIVVGDGQEIRTTQAYEELKNLIIQERPDIVVIDTLGKFIGISNENDNAALTRAIAKIDDLCRQYDCTIVGIHHIAKSGPAIINDEHSLFVALDQSAVRGGGASVGSARWVLTIAPMGIDLAHKILGVEDECLDGLFLAARVCKKNCGPVEERQYFKRAGEGLFVRIIADTSAQRGVAADGRALADEIARREQMLENPVPASKAHLVMPRWGVTRGKSAVNWALEQGLLLAVKSEHGRGKILIPNIKKEGSEGPELSSAKIESSEVPESSR